MKRINWRLRGWPSFTLKRLRPAATVSPASSSCFASAARLLQSSVWRFTRRSTSGLYLSNWCDDWVDGPEMISGVRASSMRIESTSSMIAR